MEEKTKEKNFSIPNRVNLIANVKAFAIFFVLLTFIDVIFFCFTSFDKSAINYIHILFINIGLSLILQFIYQIFDVLGLIVSFEILLLIGALYLIEIGIYKTYNVFMPIIQAANNVENVSINYFSELMTVVTQNRVLILGFLIVLAITFIISFKLLIGDDEKDRKLTRGEKGFNILLLVAGVVLISLCYVVADKNSDFSINTTKFGFKTAFVRSTYRLNEKLKFKKKRTKQQEEFLNNYNVLDIDYENIETEGVSVYCKDMNKYVSSVEPSNKNDYTGLFKGKNLILICAEAFSSHVVDEKLTPTLYRLIHNGFYFSDYYVPSWGGSTTSGEYAFLTGLIPNNAPDTMKLSIGNNMCFTLPRALKREGYTTGAYHNGNYKYYDRHLTHRANMGFEYFLATGNGLEDIAGEWSNDVDMIEKTFETYHSKTPFCMYYMTLSGHAFYNDNNSYKVTRYIEKVRDRWGIKYPDQVNNYLCYQMYLEEALTKLLEQLDKYGMTEDTVICMTADHYPYGLNSVAFTDGVNYLSWLYGKRDLDNFDIDKNVPILWSGCLETKYKDMVKTIDVPTSSIDLTPTLLNLFGSSYDSRLITGRDVFSNTLPLVVYNSGSFICEKGKYYKLNNKFVPNKDVVIDDAEIDYYKEIVKNKIASSLYILSGDYYNYLFTNSDIDDETKSKMAVGGLTLPVELKGNDYENYVEYFEQCNKDFIDNHKRVEKNRRMREKTIYLTFDDGPGPQSEKILDTLKANGVKATFFITGASKPKIVKRMKEEGHTIALHTYSHNYSYIYADKESFLKDLYEVQNFVYSAIGEYTHIYRFPGGSKNQVSDDYCKNIMTTLRPLVEDLGFEYYDWNVSVQDSSPATKTDTIIENFKIGLKMNYKEYTYLLHDLYQYTPEALDEMIKYAKENGFRFDKITDTTFPIHR